MVLTRWLGTCAAGGVSLCYLANLKSQLTSDSSMPVPRDSPVDLSMIRSNPIVMLQIHTAVMEIMQLRIKDTAVNTEQMPLTLSIARFHDGWSNVQGF